MPPPRGRAGGRRSPSSSIAAGSGARCCPRRRVGRTRQRHLARRCGAPSRRVGASHRGDHGNHGRRSEPGPAIRGRHAHRHRIGAGTVGRGRVRGVRCRQRDARADDVDPRVAATRRPAAAAGTGHRIRAIGEDRPLPVRPSRRRRYGRGGRCTVPVAGIRGAARLPPPHPATRAEPRPATKARWPFREGEAEGAPTPTASLGPAIAGSGGRRNEPGEAGCATPASPRSSRLPSRPLNGDHPPRRDPPRSGRCAPASAPFAAAHSVPAGALGHRIPTRRTPPPCPRSNRQRRRARPPCAADRRQSALGDHRVGGADRERAQAVAARRRQPGAHGRVRRRGDDPPPRSPVPSPRDASAHPARTPGDPGGREASAKRRPSSPQRTDRAAPRRAREAFRARGSGHRSGQGVVRFRASEAP